MSEKEEEWEELTDWERSVVKDLRGLRKEQKAIAKQQKRLINLLSERLEKEAKKPKRKIKPKITSKIASMIKECTTWLGEFDVNRFIELAQKEEIVGDDSFSDEDIVLIHKTLPDPDLLLESESYEEVIKTLSEKLGIKPSRFEEAIAKEEPVWLPADSEYWEEEKKKPEEKEAEAPLPSTITVIERKISEEETEEEE